MQNIQYRIINAPSGTLGDLLEAVASPEGKLWPAPAWPPLILDAGLTPGSSGGHGPIRYRVTDHDPGRRVRFKFAPDLGLAGFHEFLIEDLGPTSCRVTHTIQGTLRGSMILLWPLAIRWLHEALLQDLFDQAERLATGQVARSARWSLWVRVLRSLRR
ncbi:hypothetical protein [Deinococcus hohokamensis]|uniref:SRPBCC family protein n=1 Tax=Deinococcus hohokamensis TaxID=309883 RepID=A0ABV9I968_9DEIO